MKTFKYRFMSRPASSFTCPMENFVAFHEDSEYRKFGIVEYSKELSIRDAEHFSLAPMWLDEYNGKMMELVGYDLIGRIEVVYNYAGQVFFAIHHDSDKTTTVWHQFFKNIEEGRYRFIEDDGHWSDPPPEPMGYTSDEQFDYERKMMIEPKPKKKTD